METGGGFGGKEEYPSIIAGHAALLAWKSGRPGQDDLRPHRGHGGDDQAASGADAASHRRHARRTPARHGHRLRDRRRRVLHAVAGRAVARHHPRGRAVRSARTCACADARSRPTCRRTARFAASARRRASSRSSGTWTRSPPPSACRPRNSAARNFIRPGDTLAVGQTIREPVDMAGTARSRVRAVRLRGKRERFARENPRRVAEEGDRVRDVHARRRLHRSGEVHCNRSSRVEATPKGTVRVLAASTEIGQGTNTIFSQIAADALGIDCDDVEVVQPDTAEVPNSGPTVASRTCMVVGKLVESAALGIKHTLSMPATCRSCTRAPNSSARASATSQRSARCTQRASISRRPACAGTTRSTSGDAYGTYAWAVYVAEVSVDMATWEVARGRLRRRAGSGQGHQSGAGRRPDRRRRRAGHRLGALRERRRGKTGGWPTRR